MIILFWLIVVIVFLLGFLNSTSKVIAIIQLFILWFLMGWNSGGTDFVGNEAIYYTNGTKAFNGISAGWLSNLISYYLHRVNVDFIHYNILTTFIVLTIFAILLFTESKRPCIVINLFCIYPFLDSVVQKRFFVGMMFIVYGLKFLKEKRKILYLGYVLLAIGFHFSFTIFLPLAFIDYLKEKKCVTIALIVEVAIILCGESILQIFFPLGKINRYIFEKNYSSTIIGVIYMATVIGYVFIVDRVCSEFVQTATVDFVRKINRLSLILVPMCLFESVYLRFYRIVLLWVYIAISNENKFSIIRKGSICIGKKNKWILVFTLYLLVVNYGIYFTSASGLKGWTDTLMQNKFLENVRCLLF